MSAEDVNEAEVNMDEEQAPETGADAAVNSSTDTKQKEKDTNDAATDDKDNDDDDAAEEDNDVKAPAHSKTDDLLGALDMPSAIVGRLIKDALPSGCSVTKDGRAAVSRATTMFILKLLATANDATRRAKRSTVMPESVLAAIKGEMDFGDAMTDALKECADALAAAKPPRAPRAPRAKKSKGDTAKEADADADVDADADDAQVAEAEAEPHAAAASGGVECAAAAPAATAVEA